MITRNTILAIAGIVVMTLTANFYSQTIECLKRTNDIADYAVPAILALALVYQVITGTFLKK